MMSSLTGTPWSFVWQRER